MQISERYPDLPYIDLDNATQTEVDFISDNFRSLTSLRLKNGTFETLRCNSDISLAIIDCNALTLVDAPNAVAVKAMRCNSLTSIEAPEATSVEIKSCMAMLSVNTLMPAKIVIIDCLFLSLSMLLNLTLYQLNSVQLSPL